MWWPGHFEQCCWQACSCMLEQSVHGLMNEQTWTGMLESSWQINSIVHIHGDRTFCQGMMKQQDWTAMLQQPWTWLLYQVVFFNIREQTLPIRQAVYNMLKHDWTILLFYQSCSIMLTVLLQGCWVNPVIASCDIFTRVASGYSAYLPQCSGHVYLLLL